MRSSDFTLSRDDERDRPASRNIARHLKMSARILHYYSAVPFYHHYAIVFVRLAGSRSCFYRYAPSSETLFLSQCRRDRDDNSDAAQPKNYSSEFRTSIPGNALVPCGRHFASSVIQRGRRSKSETP